VGGADAGRRSLCGQSHFYHLESSIQTRCGYRYAEILRELCTYTDGAWMSAKKDHLLNVGSWLAAHDPELY